MRKVNTVARRHTKRIIYLPENPDATSSFRSATAKPVIVNCRPPDYTARGGLHISHRGWCGTMVWACSKTRQPVRRPNLRCALLRPVSQSAPQAGICRPIFGQCAALAPPIFVAAPLCQWCPREPACPSSTPNGGSTSTHFPPNRPQTPDNNPRPHLTSESWSSLQNWAARTSPLTARRVVLAPKSCGSSSFRGTSSRATCRVRSPSCSEETCIRTRAMIRPHCGHLTPSPFRDFASARTIAPPGTHPGPALQ